jgi:hypothetical protein
MAYVAMLRYAGSRYKTGLLFTIPHMKAHLDAILDALQLGLPLAVLILVGTVATRSLLPQDFGVSLPQGPAVFETSLQSRISSSDTSMTLVANSVRGGSTLSGYQCFTIDEGRTDMEYICGTISGTTVSSLERGIDPLTATTTNSTLKYAHRVGANVKVTDFPLIQRLRNLANSVEYFPTLLQYATTTTLCGVGSSNYTICDKAYIDGVAVAGASNANETTKGISELATALEAGSSTSLGGTGARLVLPASVATDTPQNCVTTGCVVVSKIGGKIRQTFLDLTEAFTWTGHHIFASLFATNASSTNATTTTALGWGSNAYLLPAAAAASSSVLSVGGTSPYQLSWVPKSAGTYSTIMTSALASNAAGFASTTLMTIPAGALSASTTIEARLAGGCNDNGGSGGTCTVYLRDSTGVTLATTAFSQGTTNNEPFSGSFDVVATALNAQTYLAVRNQVQQGTPTTGDFAAQTGTSAVNLGNALSLVVVVHSTNANVSLDRLSLIVTP